MRCSRSEIFAQSHDISDVGGVTVVVFSSCSRLEFQYNRSRTHVLHLTRHRRLDEKKRTNLYT
jgi:hypothetical protein